MSFFPERIDLDRATWVPDNASEVEGAVQTQIFNDYADAAILRDDPHAKWSLEKIAESDRLKEQEARGLR